MIASMSLLHEKITSVQWLLYVTLLFWAFNSFITLDYKFLLNTSNCTPKVTQPLNLVIFFSIFYTLNLFTMGVSYKKLEM